MLADQERVAPARRRDHRHAPRTAGERARHRRADLEAAPRLRPGRIELGLARELRGLRGRHRRAVGADQPAPVRVHGERHHRVGEPLAVHVQVQHRVHERVAERVVQGLVGVGEVDPVTEQGRGEILGAGAMARDRERLVLGLVPPVLAAMPLPRLDVDRVVGQHRERRHAVLTVVLVLVVAPQQHEVGLEGVELGANLPEVMDQVAAVPLGVGQAFVGAPLLAHRRMPALRRPQLLGQHRVRQQHFDPARHVALVRHRGIVGDAEPKDLSHGSSSSSLVLVVSPPEGS